MPPMADTRDRAAQESRRILERVAQEDTSFAARTARRVRDHVTAVDTDRDDWAEYWGTRIGRAVALVVLAGMIVWLILYLARGA